MTTTSISIIIALLSVLSGIINVIDKKSNKDKKAKKSKLSVLNWISIILITLICAVTIKLLKLNTLANSKNHDAEIIRHSEILQTYKYQRLKDSIQIKNLKDTIVNNAIMIIREQRNIIEKDKENIFKNLKFEIGYNLNQTINTYSPWWVMRYKERGNFIAEKMSHDFVNKYQSITTNSSILLEFAHINSLIDLINFDIERIFSSKDSTEWKNHNIELFLTHISSLTYNLSKCYYYIANLNTYKQFESIGINEITEKQSERVIKYFNFESPEGHKKEDIFKEDK